MSKEQKITEAVYRQIAIDIATHIVAGKYVEGQKLFGRSVLASQYQVSPETIRKAVFLLKDVGILATEKGSGIEVLSLAKAKDFVAQYNQTQKMVKARQDVADWGKRQIKETAEMVEKLQFIIESASQIRGKSIFEPFEIEVPADSPVIGKTVTDTHFWHNTGGTIIAIRRGDELILSPGPYAGFLAGDIFYVIGSEEAFAAATALIKEAKT